MVSQKIADSENRFVDESELATPESLKALECLMTEFFEHSTSNLRKREIEELLNNFGQQQDAWRHCLFFMANSRNEYVMMYALNIVEGLINRQWVGLPAEEKMEIRSTLNSFLITHHQNVPFFIRNKLCKLVVDIGRLDWPHFYPDFFSSILQLVQQSDTAVLGLILLHTTSEELASPREDLSMARREELHRLLIHQVPAVLSILNSILSSILEKHRSMVTATPPPSPTQGRAHTSLSSSPMAIISSSPMQSSHLLSNMFKSPQSRVQLESLPPLDSSACQVTLLALNCLSHLFSWIPLSVTITPNLLSTIFHYAAFGCEASPSARGGRMTSFEMPQQNGSRNSSNCGIGGCESLGVLAMNCINELLSKNCVPNEFEDFLLQMFQQTFYLLTRITKDSTTTASGNRLAELDDNYVAKFTEFLRLFVSIHFRRFESNTHFPVIDFLNLFFRYTFKQPTHEGLFSCLDTWAVFLDYLTTKMESKTTDKENLFTKYQEALVLLVTEVLHKIQFCFNQNQLDELDDDTLDDDSETEWQHFLRQCLEIVAKVVELLPAEVFRLIYEPFQEHAELYLGLQQFITGTAPRRRLNVRAENECRRLHCALRDLSSLLQALGRLSEHFCGEHFESRLSDSVALMERLVHIAQYSCTHKLFEVNSMAGNTLQGDFVEVHAQSLAAVKASVNWLAQYYTHTLGVPEQRQHCATLINTIVDAVFPLFDKGTPEKVVQSAAHLLLSVLMTVRTDILLTHPKLQQLYSAVSQGSLQHCPPDVQLLVYRGLSHYLLLPWAGAGGSWEQQWDVRAHSHKLLISHLTSNYRQLKPPAMANNKSMQMQVKPCVQHTLQVLTDLVETLTVQGVSKSKQICYNSIQESVQASITLFPIFIQSTDITDDLLGFFLALFQGLRVQMGVSFTEQVIQTFMNMFTSEQLSQHITQETPAGVKVVEKFLNILQVIVQEPGAAFKTLVPNIITICIEHIYPIIATRASPDIKATLYELLHQLLLNNWRYFFKGSVFTTLNNQIEDVDNQQQFIAIMMSYGQSFLQPDIAVFQQNLGSLETLNVKLKLYHKSIFRELMLERFLEVLLQVLVHRSHDLLQEEIGITIYNMAAVDFDVFFANFLPQFLTNCDGIDDTQKATLAQNFKLEKDLPSFTQSVHRFVNDLRYYRLCNSSLPQGSVKL